MEKKRGSQKTPYLINIYRLERKGTSTCHKGKLGQLEETQVLLEVLKVIAKEVLEGQ